VFFFGGSVFRYFSISLFPGTVCIEQSVELKKALPPADRFPLFMRIFEGMTLCCSGFSKEERVTFSPSHSCILFAPRSCTNTKH
jgi:hypothetical protein